MKQQESQNPFFHIFEKRRVKVNQIHRERREQLFNKSRKIFQQDENQQKNLLNRSEKLFKFGDIKEQEGESSLNIQKNEDNFFQIEQNQIKTSLQSISISQQNQQFQKKASQHFIEDEKKKLQNVHKRQNKFSFKYAKIIQIPSWMNTVPEQLHNFYCMARPNGKTGLLVFTGNWIKIYDKFGKYISIKKISQNDKINQNQIKKVAKNLEGTTLQISYNLETKTIYITDVLFWKNSILTAQNFEFRYAWLMSNIGSLINSKTGLKIYLIQYLPLTVQQNLKKVYCQNFGYEKQGLLFIHKQSPYIHGYNQNVLIWKDINISKYPFDSQIKQKTISKFIYGTGKLSKGSVYSLDGYKLGYINPNCLPGISKGYIRFRITKVCFNNEGKKQQTQMKQQRLQKQEQDNKNSRINLSFENFQVINYKKYGKGEPLSRIMFQFRIRHDPLTIQQIANKIIKL